MDPIRSLYTGSGQVFLLWKGKYIFCSGFVQPRLRRWVQSRRLGGRSTRPPGPARALKTDQVKGDAHSQSVFEWSNHSDSLIDVGLVHSMMIKDLGRTECGLSLSIKNDCLNIRYFCLFVWSNSLLIIWSLQYILCTFAAKSKVKKGSQILVTLQSQKCFFFLVDVPLSCKICQNLHMFLTFQFNEKKLEIKSISSHNNG